MNILIFIIVFFSMEAVAWFTHKYVMHGFLWHLHEDHHKRDDGGFFEKNDYFFVIFALPGIVLLAVGVYGGLGWALASGLGITLYGFAYFAVHDIFIHRRFKVFSKSKNTYLSGIRKAHKVHHKKLSKQGGECFGMLMVPFRYFRKKP